MKIEKLIEEARTGTTKHRAIREAAAEVAETNKVKSLLREMFKDRALDPHPTSDAAPESVLAAWCGYEEEDT